MVCQRHTCHFQNPGVAFFLIWLELAFFEVLSKKNIKNFIKANLVINLKSLFFCYCFFCKVQKGSAVFCGNFWTQWAKPSFKNNSQQIHIPRQTIAHDTTSSVTTLFSCFFVMIPWSNGAYLYIVNWFTKHTFQDTMILHPLWQLWFQASNFSQHPYWLGQPYSLHPRVSNYLKTYLFCCPRFVTTCLKPDPVP